MAVFRLIKETFVTFYEYLFKLVFIDLIWFFLTSIILFFGYTSLVNGWVLPVILPLILTGPILLSALHTINGIMEYEAGIKDFFRGIVSYFKKGLVSFLYTFFVYLILVFDLLYFVQKGSNSNLMLVIGVVFLYLIIFFSMVQIYFWGLLVVQKKEKVTTIIKRSFLLTLDNTLLAFLMLLFLIIFSIVMFISGVGLPVLLIGIIGIFLIKGTKHTLAKYNVK